MAVTGKSLATALGINGAVCIVAFIIFSVLRIRPFTRKFYAPKRYDPEVKHKPRKLPGSLFGWMGPTLLYPEDEILTVAGMDVVVMSRLLMYGWVLFAFCTIFCCPLLMPIDGTAGGLASPPPVNATYSDLDFVGASNVPPANPRFWAHVVAVYVVSAVALLLLLAFSRDISRLRARYISMLPRGSTSHTVLVTDIPCIDGVGAAAPKPGPLDKLTGLINRKGDPAALEYDDVKAVSKPVSSSSCVNTTRVAPLEDGLVDPWADARTHLAGGSPDDMVRREMERTYGHNSVAAVNVVTDTRKLDPLLTKYNASKQKLDDLTSSYIGKLKNKKEIKKRAQVTLLPALTPKWAKDKYSVGTKKVSVDALEYLPQEMEHLYGEIQSEKQAVADSCLPAAFVTFNDRLNANAAATGLHSYDEAAWRVQPAPDSDEVLWGNLPMRRSQRVARGLITGAIFVAILVFYLPVTAAIQAVVNLDNVKSVPGLGKVTELPFVTQVLQGILPTIVLKVFLILIPPILGMMARFEGKVSLSEVDFSIVSRFFTFQVFATFIYQFVVGSALGRIQAIIADPSGQIINILGVAAAQTSSFFMSYIMINALAVGMGLLRLVPLILFFVFYKLAGTDRARYRLWAKQPFMFGTNVANHTIIMLLGLAFCCLAPLIAPFALLYFTLALLAQKYQLLYVVTLAYDASGRMWKNVFTQIMVGIYFLQVMVIAVLAVKKFPYAAFIIPLIIFTIIYHRVFGSMFARPWTLGNAREAAMLDARDHAPVSAAEAEATRLNYLSPVYKIDEAEHSKLISEAAEVNKALKGESHTLDLADAAEAAEAGEAASAGVAAKAVTGKDQPKTVGAQEAGVGSARV